MKSKASVRQRSRPVVRMHVALATVAIMLALSSSALAQGRLPFIGTRTFCAEFATTAIVSIRKDGFTTIKTNMLNGLIRGLAVEPAKAPYETYSGMLNAKGILRRGKFELTIKSGTDIIVYEYPDQDSVHGKLCTSEAAVPKKSNDVQRTPTVPPSAGSNPPPGAQAQSTPTKQIAPDTLVTNLYRQAGEGEIVDGRKGASLTDRVFQTRSRALIDKYFDKGFADVMWKALLRYERMRAYDDPGSFGGFLYGYLGDDEISKGLVGKPSYDGQKAQVIVSFDARSVFEEEQAHKESVVFLLAAGQTGWKITDIKYDDVLCGAGKTSLFDEFNMDSKATDAESKIWNAIECNDAQGFKHYLQKYPNGAYSSVARAKIREIESGKKTQPDSQPTDRQPLNSGGNKKGSASTPAITNTDSSGATLLNSQTKLTPEDVNRLKANVDPNTGESCDFPDDPKVQPRLKLLLGEELPHLEDNLRRGSGCWIKNGWLGFDGFQPHNGGQEHGFISINLNNGGLVAGLFTNTKFKIYGITQAYNGDLKTLPGPLADWIHVTWALANSLNKNPAAPPSVELQRSQPIKTAAAGPTSGAPTQTYIEVSLKEAKDLKALGTSFPFLKSELDEVIADNKDTTVGLGPTHVYVSDLNQNGMPRLIFVAMDGNYCGSAGCGLTVYLNQGKGFGHALDALVDIESPIYISKDQSSLLTCGSGGRGEWRYKNNEFQAVPGKPRPSQNLAPCGTHTISDAATADNPVTSSTTARTPTPGKQTNEVVNETKVDPAAAELSYWESIRNSTNPEDFKAYLEKYPNGQFAELAKLRVRRARPVGTPSSGDAAAAERVRNTRVFEVRDASKTSGWLTVAPGSVTFEPKKAQAGKNTTIQCSDIKHIEQGQSAVASPHVNLFLTAVTGKEGPVVFYTSSGGTGLVGVFVKGLPAKPVVDITANVIRAITEACR